MLRRSATTLFVVGATLATGSVAYADAAVPLPAATADYDGHQVELRRATDMSPDALSTMKWDGTATNFRTSDPAFSCLNGSELEVFRASSDTFGSSALLAYRLSNTDPDCLPTVPDLTWVAEPGVFFANKAVRMSKAAEETGGTGGHAPRIDLYLTDGYGSYSPCTREVLGDGSKKYACRTINYQTKVIPTVSPSILATVAVDYGEASGGGGYSVYTTEKRVYEGCDVRDNEWVCAAHATDISNKSFATSGKWYKNAYDRWADDTSYAVQCTAALYNQDAQAIAEDCIPTNYLGWAKP